MRLTTERLKKLIREELKKINESNLMLPAVGAGKRPDVPDVVPMIVLLLLAMYGVNFTYEELTADPRAIAEEIAELPKEEIEIVLKKRYVTLGDMENYDYGALAQKLSDMSVDELEEQFEYRSMRRTFRDYKAILQDAPSAGEELALPKDSGDLYKESKKRRRVKRRRS